MPRKRAEAGKIACVSDPHQHNHTAHARAGEGGLNSRGQLCVKALAEAAARARGIGCKAFYVAGDLFHARRPEAAVIAAVQRTLSWSSQCPSVVLPGNHDLVDQDAGDGNTACQPLELAGVRVVNQPTWVKHEGFSVLAVPFTSRVPMRDHLKKVLTSFDGPPAPEGPKVLVTHIGVTDDSTAPWLRGKPDSVDAEELFEWMRVYGFAGAFVGNYHEHLMKTDGPLGPWICQVGTLCPAGHGDDGVFPAVGGMAVWGPDMELPTLEEIPGPRFLTLDPGEGIPVGASGNQYFVRARVAPDGRKPDLAGAAGVVEVLQAPASELGAVPEREIDDAREAVVQWCAANNISDESRDLALEYLKKGA